jgi:delta 1-pyrroline-5-carboxylate dehydrogenase
VDEALELREQLAESDRQHKQDLAERDAEIAKLKRDVAQRDSVIARFRDHARQNIELDALDLPQSQSVGAQASRSNAILASITIPLQY